MYAIPIESGWAFSDEKSTTLSSVADRREKTTTSHTERETYSLLCLSSLMLFYFCCCFFTSYSSIYNNFFLFVAIEPDGSTICLSHSRSVRYWIDVGFEPKTHSLMHSSHGSSWLCQRNRTFSLSPSFHTFSSASVLFFFSFTSLFCTSKLYNAHWLHKTCALLSHTVGPTYVSCALVQSCCTRKQRTHVTYGVLNTRRISNDNDNDFTATECVYACTRYSNNSRRFSFS